MPVSIKRRNGVALNNVRLNSQALFRRLQTSGTSKQIANALRGSLLTAKQKKALRSSAATASARGRPAPSASSPPKAKKRRGAASARSAVGSRSGLVRTEQVASNLLTGPLGSLVGTEPRDKSAYNELYAMSGGAPNLHIPRPYHTGLTSTERSAFVLAASPSTTITIPAGESVLVVPTPFNNMSSMWVFTSGTGMTVGAHVTNLNWTGHEIVKDRFDQVVGSYFARIGWEGYHPNSHFGSGSFVAAGTVRGQGVANGNVEGEFNDPAGRHPVAQLAFCKIDARTVTTYQGGLEVRTLSPGDAPAWLGRNRDVHHRLIDDTAVNQTKGTFSLQQDFLVHPLYQASSSESPQAVVSRIGRLHLQPGNSERNFIVNCMPGTTWLNFGQLSSTTSVDNAETSAYYGFVPRDNLAYHVSQFSAILFRNTTTVPATAYVRASFGYHQLVQTDDGGTTISALASQMREVAHPIRPHFPPPTMKPYLACPSICSPTLPERGPALAAGVAGTGVHPAIANAIGKFHDHLHTARAIVGTLKTAVTEHPVETAAIAGLTAAKGYAMYKGAKAAQSGLAARAAIGGAEAAEGVEMGAATAATAAEAGFGLEALVPFLFAL